MKGGMQQPTLKALRLEAAAQYGIIAANWATAEEKEAARVKRDALLEQIKELRGRL